MFRAVRCSGPRRILACSVLGLAAAVAAAGRGAAEFHPKIPRVWVDVEVADSHLPLASPAPAVHPFPVAWYYAIPPITIYKSYPIHSPDKDDRNYFHWLTEQEPQIAVDLTRLRAEGDWIRAGEDVYFAPGDGPNAFRAVDAPLEDPPPQVRYVIRTKGHVEATNARGAGCSRCHTQQLADGTIVNGGQEPHRFVTQGRYNGRTPEERQRQLFEIWGAPWLHPDPNTRVGLNVPLAEMNGWFSTGGSNQRPGTGPTSPAQIPILIGLKDIKYFDHTGLHPHRSIVDLMRYAVLASFTSMEPYFRYGDVIPGGEHDYRELPDPKTQKRYTDEQLYALALYLYSLPFPPNPNHPDALSARGEEVFRRSGCPRCHTPPLYTNNKLIPVDGFVVPDEHKERYDILDVRIGLDDYLATKTRKGTGYYKVPSLRGLWLRTVVEHNGSVSLEEWFNPHRLETDYVPTGFVGPAGHRAVKGHAFGLHLSDEDKRALIAFLRTL